MDIDHLHKLVVAVRDEGEAINRDGPAHEDLMAYLNEEGPRAREDLLLCLERCFVLWVRATRNTTFGATEIEWREQITKALGSERTSAALKLSGVPPTIPTRLRHG